MQRTTITADNEALETLRAEARRRNVSLIVALREAVDEKAASIRFARRPRLKHGRSSHSP
jgi:ribbon-helix-helix CopG family protein